MKLIQGTRMVRTNKNRREHTYTLFNNIIGKEIVINEEAAKFLMKMQKNKKIWNRNEAFTRELESLGFLIKNDNCSVNESSINNYKYKKYPLTSLAIELTNGCNLKCIHCYGKYGHSDERKKFFPYEKLERMIPELNELGTLRIALTGGEPTTHPDFIKIVVLLLKQGFDVTVLTNGYNYIKIKELLNATKNYHYMIKVSLDGVAEKHDEIRGIKNSFKNVITTLRMIQENKNITCMISTVEMKQNEEDIENIIKYVRENFPEMKHTLDFAFAGGNAADSQCAFSIQEIKQIVNERKEEMPLYNINNGRPLSRYRCSGGISQCTITSRGELKICTAANYPQFMFKYNAFQKGITYAWQNCGTNIKKYRKEKVHETEDCKRCKYKSQCGIVDCRMLAMIYTGSEQKSSPLTCAITENILLKNEREFNENHNDIL